jgi:hypothetical protein
MLDAPQQDWAYYEARCRASEIAWMRSLTPQEKFALYADLFNLIWSARRQPGDWQRLDDWAWRKKLALRDQQVHAFAQLDARRRERTPQ